MRKALPDEVSFAGQILHFLGEVEAVFGIWVLVLPGLIASDHDAEVVHQRGGVRLLFQHRTEIGGVLQLGWIQSEGARRCLCSRSSS